MNKVKVTIGMPTFNRGSYLKETINRVLQQSFHDFELIISDDCSTDTTEAEVRSFQDPRICYIRNKKNYGIPENLNRILKLAQGQYIIMLHDHDVFHPLLLEKLVSFLEKNPEVGFVHPGVAWIDHDGENYQDLLLDFPPLMKGNDLAEAILFMKTGIFSCPITACSMVPRHAYEKVGFLYDPQFGFLSDVDLWLKLCLYFDVGYVREPLLTCRRREDGQSVNWDWVSWAAKIYAVNIERHFKNSPVSLEKAKDLWLRTREKFFLNSIIACIAKGDLKGFQKGLELTNALPLRYPAPLNFLRQLSALHPTIVSAGASLNWIRKKIHNLLL